MFVAQAKYDETVRQLQQLTEENARLNTQLASLNDQQSQITALQEQVNAVTSERDSARSEAETLLTENTDLTSQVNTLTQENETLRQLPGAETATTRSETEQSNGEAMNDLDKLNEFCKNNSNDLNACMAAIEKYNNQLKK